MHRFFKASGGGNDFLALVEPERAITPEEVRAWCTRGTSLGADGVFVLRRRAPGEVTMDYWNADGGAADLCLNGTRCAARLAFHLGWAHGTVTVVTGAGPVPARLHGATGVALDLPPLARPPENRAPVVDGLAYPGLFVTVGVPHFILFGRKSLQGAPLATLGPRLRHHPDFGPAGANVDWVRFLPDRRGFEIRTFERGVEGETLACGTGVMACAAAGLALEAIDLPARALTAGGFTFEVSGAVKRTLPVTWSLAGDARLIAEGTLFDEAGAVPRPAEWG